jgi:hypothetical protein
MKRWEAQYLTYVPGFSNSAADVGTAVHGGLEMFVKAVHIDKTHAGMDRVKQKELLITFYQMSYVQTFGTSNMETVEYKDGFDLTMKWFQRTNLSNRTVESAELKERTPIPFNHPEGPTHSCSNCDGTGDPAQGAADVRTQPGVCVIPFTSIMDRVDQIAETEWEVVDYKTVRVPISPEDLETKIQARAYALRIQIKHPEATRIKVTFDLLRHEPVSITFTRDDNIAFWNYLLAETQRIVNENNPVATLNPECQYCPIKATCPLMLKNLNNGGIMSLDVDGKADLLAKLQDQMKANARLAEELEEAIMLHASQTDLLEWQTADGARTVEIGLTAGRRQVDAHRAAEIMGPDLFAQIGTVTVGNLEKIIKDESLDPLMREALKTTMTKGNGNLKVYVKKAKKLI